MYDLKKKPQVPSIHAWLRTGLTTERSDAPDPHYKGIFDDKGRMMAIVCHNTDLGDGWRPEDIFGDCRSAGHGGLQMQQETWAGATAEQRFAGAPCPLVFLVDEGSF